MKQGLIFIVLVLLCGFLLWAVGAQRAELSSLKRQQRTLLNRLTPESVRSEVAIESNSSAVSPDLLRLRNDASRLTARKAELAHVVKENLRLQAECQRAATNKAQLAAGYIRRSEARMVGFGSPEATIQTMLWALRNRDYERFLEAFTPEAAERMRARTSGSTDAIEKFHQEAQAVIGMGITERVSNSDGSIEIKLQVLPGLPPASVSMVNAGGEWKLAEEP